MVWRWWWCFRVGAAATEGGLSGFTQAIHGRCTYGCFVVCYCWCRGWCFNWTDLALLDIEGGKFILRERAPGVSVEEIANLTSGELVIPDNVPEMVF